MNCLAKLGDGRVMVETIIFDGEGVVIDSEKIWDHGQEEFLRRRGIVYNRKHIKPLLTGASLVDGVKVLQGEFKFSGEVKDLVRERMDIVRGMFETDVGLMDGFEEFFEKVRGQYKTCLATAMPEEFFAIVKTRLRLKEFFGNNMFSLKDVENRSKPDPALFLYAAKKLGSKPDCCVVIEDSPYGIEAARRAGMKSIGFATTFDRAMFERADFIADSFREIDMGRLTNSSNVVRSKTSSC